MCECDMLKEGNEQGRYKTLLGFCGFFVVLSRCIGKVLDMVRQGLSTGSALEFHDVSDRYDIHDDFY